MLVMQRSTRVLSGQAKPATCRTSAAIAAVLLGSLSLGCTAKSQGLSDAKVDIAASDRGIDGRDAGIDSAARDGLAADSRALDSRALDSSVLDGRASDLARDAFSPDGMIQPTGPAPALVKSGTLAATGSHPTAHVVGSDVWLFFNTNKDRNAESPLMWTLLDLVNATTTSPTKVRDAGIISDLYEHPNGDATAIVSSRAYGKISVPLHRLVKISADGKTWQNIDSMSASNSPSCISRPNARLLAEDPLQWVFYGVHQKGLSCYERMMMTRWDNTSWKRVDPSTRGISKNEVRPPHAAFRMASGRIYLHLWSALVSDDNGATFTPTTSISRVMAKSENNLVALAEYPVSSTQVGAWVKRSVDEGKTWQSSLLLSFGAARPLEGATRIVSDGKRLAMVLRHADSRLSIRTSPDGGQSWSPPTFFAHKQQRLDASIAIKGNKIAVVGRRDDATIWWALYSQPQ
jgi:hypothetical protein